MIHSTYYYTCISLECVLNLLSHCNILSDSIYNTHCYSMEFGEDFPNQIAPCPYNAVADLMPIDEEETTTETSRFLHP